MSLTMLYNSMWISISEGIATLISKEKKNQKKKEEKEWAKAHESNN